MPDALADREVFVEIRSESHGLRVTAIDAASGIEVVLSAPRHTPAQSAQQAALQKLRYVLEKKGILTTAGTPSKDPGPGTLA